MLNRIKVAGMLVVFLGALAYMVVTKDTLPIMACEEEDKDLYILKEYTSYDSYVVMLDGRSFERTQCLIEK